MGRRFVIESVLVAIYGQLMVPSRPVEYILPYSTLAELYELKDSPEPVMPDEQEDAHVKSMIGELIQFFEDSLNKKKIERALAVPWRKSPPILVNEMVSFTIINSVDNAHYGEIFDPIETELILTAIHEKVPMLTDQIELVDKMIQGEVPVQVFDVEDFEFALEDERSSDDFKTLL
ncbi:ADP-heptose synthase [Paenibacillus sp. FJAT-26967]|uniref:ADP-heptose synthase n=1 Tax=Paenibacillus sp. FJAT-26967 TaxID=1729690 RepID=UPI00083860C4|nr:ADP-heptose synthase [Paenibacillus sp. FJAT-26967]